MIPRLSSLLFLGSMAATYAASATEKPPAGLIEEIAKESERHSECSEMEYSAQTGKLAGKPVWIIAHPLFCSEEKPGSGYFEWEWGGTAGPMHEVFMLDDGEWQRIRRFRHAHKVWVSGNDTITVSRHHISCENTVEPGKGFLTRYLWNGQAFEVENRNFEFTDDR